MKTLVIFDSEYGNTAQIAQRVAQALQPFGQISAQRVTPQMAVDLRGVDLLVLGSPTQGFRPTLSMQRLVEQIGAQRERGAAIACFDTRFRGPIWKISAAPWMCERLRAKGFARVMPPESFFVKSMKKEGPLLPDEADRAAHWGRELLTALERLEPALR